MAFWPRPFTGNTCTLLEGIVVELLEQLAYLALLIKPAEKPARERVQMKNHQENCLLARGWASQPGTHCAPYAYLTRDIIKRRAVRCLWSLGHECVPSHAVMMDGEPSRGLRLAKIRNMSTPTGLPDKSLVRGVSYSVVASKSWRWRGAEGHLLPCGLPRRGVRAVVETRSGEEYRGLALPHSEREDEPSQKRRTMRYGGTET